MPEMVGRVPENEMMRDGSVRSYVSEWKRDVTNALAYAESKGTDTQRFEMLVEGVDRLVKMMDGLKMLDKKLPEEVWMVALSALTQTIGRKDTDEVFANPATFLSILASLNQLAK